MPGQLSNLSHGIHVRNDHCRHTGVEDSTGVPMRLGGHSYELGDTDKVTCRDHLLHSRHISMECFVSMNMATTPAILVMSADSLPAHSYAEVVASPKELWPREEREGDW